MTTDETPPVPPRETRRAALIEELTTRLGAVCEGWPPEVFASMIEGLADITLRYDRGAAPSTYDRRSTDAMIADMKDLIDRNVIARNELGGAEGGPNASPPVTD